VGQAQNPIARPPGGPAVELVHATSGRPEVALTFHGAGDPALGRSVLEALRKADVAATVLAVGTWLQSNPDAARMVTDLGHELGNHTWSHRVMSALSVSAQRSEIERCRDRIAALTGGPGAFFRQSSARLPTPELLKLAGAAGYPRVLAYDVDSLDYTDPAPETVRRQVAAAKAGSIVSMHLGHPVTLAALPGILADLRRRELRAVSATRLFSA
jgi:peptidoglycan/xylan/chitin deacetylase (PgdA/CDA1 family)